MILASPFYRLWRNSPVRLPLDQVGFKLRHCRTASYLQSRLGSSESSSLCWMKDLKRILNLLFFCCFLFDVRKGALKKEEKAGYVQ